MVVQLHNYCHNVRVSLDWKLPSCLAQESTNLVKDVCKAGTVSLTDVIKIAAEAEVTKQEMSEMKTLLNKKCPEDSTDDVITVGLNQIGQLQKQMLTDMKGLTNLVNKMAFEKEIGGQEGTENQNGGEPSDPVTRPAPAPGDTCFTAERTCYTGYGHYYRGEVNVTRSGRTCQAWTDQSPHAHTRTTHNYPHDDLVGNYCRNPDIESMPWCYTTDPGTRWEVCDISTC
uniref:Kringle domain-containing protein n=1 Tax=Branchiostoma floridae TaxID=7739 RepID=C3Y7H7_BRAFL|eukprot:XP_002607795.1 hypothetical protein BRAFLDRAFT_64139 [Branchiostoma floridae]